MVEKGTLILRLQFTAVSVAVTELVNAWLENLLSLNKQSLGFQHMSKCSLSGVTDSATKRFSPARFFAKLLAEKNLSYLCRLQSCTVTMFVAARI